MAGSGRTLKLALVAGLSLTWTGSVWAETLADALDLAYRTNPDLQGARANLRSVDETYVQARAGWQPQLDLGLSTQYNKDQTTNFFGTPVINETNGASAILNLSQPLYTGGLVGAQVKQAQSDIQGQRETLRGAEANVLYQVISAYLDVLRDQQALQISRAALGAYGREVDEINARQKAGQLTRTDIAQAQAQQQNQQAVANNAEAQLQASIAAYVAAVGQNPATLEAPPVLPGLPASADEAQAVAEKNSPSLGIAESRVESAQAKVAQARSTFRPKVSVGARVGTAGPVNPFDAQDYKYSVAGQITLSQPLFSGGLHLSQVRQAQAVADASQKGVDSARRGVTQNVANAWNAMITAQRNVAAGAAAVDSTAQAFQGMQIEYRADQRSTYELLNAESALYAAELNLNNARHDQYLASARLLGVIGRLEAADLIDQLRAYDPEVNLTRVRSLGFFPTGYVAAMLDKIAAPSEAVRTPPPLPAPAAPPVLRPSIGLPPIDAPLTGAAPTTAGG